MIPFPPPGLGRGKSGRSGLFGRQATETAAEGKGLGGRQECRNRDVVDEPDLTPLRPFTTSTPAPLLYGSTHDAVVTAEVEMISMDASMSPGSGWLEGWLRAGGLAASLPSPPASLSVPKRDGASLCRLSSAM